VGRRQPGGDGERLQAFGIGEIVVKNGSSTALVADKSGREHVPVPEVVEPVDTTAAGIRSTPPIWRRGSRASVPVPAVNVAHGLAGQGDPPSRARSCRGRQGRCIRSDGRKSGHRFSVRHRDQEKIYGRPVSIAAHAARNGSGSETATRRPHHTRRHRGKLEHEQARQREQRPGDRVGG
jgi:hypothetical protein